MEEWLRKKLFIFFIFFIKFLVRPTYFSNIQNNEQLRFQSEAHNSIYEVDME